jgi:hypothetical protein
MTLLRTLRIVAALGALPLAGCGGDAFSLAADAGASGSAKSGAASGTSSGASSGAASAGSSGTSSGASSGAASAGSSGTSSGTSSGSSSGTAPSGSSSGAPDAGGGLVCPASAPNPGSACPRVGFDCEYGTSPNLACNQLARCVAAGWSYPLHPTCPMGTCAGTYDAIQAGSACSPDGLTCAYPKGTCICATPSGPVVRLDGGGAQWQCRPSTLACRSPRPNVGTPCTEEGRTCDYGSCISPPGVVLQCRSAVWQEGPSPPCPL